MHDREQERPASRSKVVFETFFLIMMAIVIYAAAILLLGEPINRHMPNWFFGPIGFLVILGLDVMWIIGMKSWHSQNERIKLIKKVLSVLVFALSASVFTSWLILNLFSDIW